MSAPESNRNCVEGLSGDPKCPPYMLNAIIPSADFPGGAVQAFAQRTIWGKGQLLYSQVPWVLGSTSVHWLSLHSSGPSDYQGLLPEAAPILRSRNAGCRLRQRPPPRRAWMVAEGQLEILPLGRSPWRSLRALYREVPSVEE